MQVVDAEIEGRCAVGPQIIRDQSIGNDGVFPQKLAHQFQRGVLVALGLDQHIQNLALGVDGAPQVNHAPIDFQIEVSGAGEFRPRALSEPDVILSHHPAPIVRPLLYGFALSVRVLPSPVALRPELNNATPRSSPITGPSSLLRVAPPLCPASVLSSSQGPPAWISPFASGRQVPAFHIEAWIRVTPPSCRMPPGQKSGHPQTRPRLTNSPWFRHHLALFDTSSAVRLRSSL